MTRVVINTDKLNTFNFQSLRDVVLWKDSVHSYDADALFYGAGNQHYQLLAAISSSLPEGSRVLEIGTRIGMSALAIMHGNRQISLTTCDLEDNIPEGKSVKAFSDDIKFLVKDGFELLESDPPWDVIFIDVDPHDGVQERRMINRLIELNFQGILLLDDIHLNSDMNALWDWIPVKKIDLTNIGHNSGTGAVLFGESKIIYL